MKRDQRLGSFGRLVLLAIFLVSGKLAWDRFGKDDARPNIILIVTDDQEADSLEFLPKIQSQLVQNGITFTNGFVASPLCIPSRASILRGQYVHSHKVTKNPRQFHDRGLDKETMATVLQEAGYQTGLVGKYFNGNLKPKKAPHGWDEWYAILTDNVYFNYRLNENGKVVSYGDEPEDYISEVLSQKSVEFVKQNSGRKPFFLHINTVAPHTPVMPSPAHAKQFEKTVFEFDFEDDLTDKPKWVEEYYQSNQESDIPYFDFNSKELDKASEWHRNRLRTLLSVDDMVDELVKTLKETKEYQNTYIFFVSDNGDGITKHIQTSAKLTPYEEGIRVPFLVIGPEVPAQQKLPHLVSTVDLLPTFAEIAGVPIPDFVDGRSLMPLVGQAPYPTEEWRQSVVAELGPVSSKWPWKSTPPMYRLLRTPRFKYIEYVTGEREYYDLILDPDEMENSYAKLDLKIRQNLTLQMEKTARWDDFTKAAVPPPK